MKMNDFMKGMYIGCGNAYVACSSGQSKWKESVIYETRPFSFHLD